MVGFHTCGPNEALIVSGLCYQGNRFSANWLPIYLFSYILYINNIQNIIFFFYRFHIPGYKKISWPVHFLICWSSLLFYSENVHKQWLKMWSLKRQMAVQSDRINFDPNLKCVILDMLIAEHHAKNHTHLHHTWSRSKKHFFEWPFICFYCRETAYSGGRPCFRLSMDPSGALFFSIFREKFRITHF